MSGHSKWSTIKRRKGAEDAKRAKIFTRIARDIMVAAREGGGDENGNPKLKLAVTKARAANMPKENVERAVKRGTGELEGVDLAELTYEAYGPEGIAYVIEVMTDNKNRSLADIKRVLNRANGSLATNGSVTWQFEQKGAIVVQPDGVDFDTLFMAAAEAGADDVVSEDGTITVFTPREQFGEVEAALTDAGYALEEAALRWLPKNEVEVASDKGVANMRLYEALEELDDVQSVASNLLMTDTVLAAFDTAS